MIQTSFRQKPFNRYWIDFGIKQGAQTVPRTSQIRNACCFFRMSLDTLFIYETVHGTDSVGRHLQELRQGGISPGFIGLELPTYGEPLGFRELLR